MRTASELSMLTGEQVQLRFSFIFSGSFVWLCLAFYCRVILCHRLSLCSESDCDSAAAFNFKCNFGLPERERDRDRREGDRQRERPLPHLDFVHFDESVAKSLTAA